MIELHYKFKREGDTVKLPVNLITGIFDGFVQVNHEKYIAVTESKEEIIEKIKKSKE